MSESTTNKPSLINLPELPDSVDNALKNLTDQPTLSIGQTISDCWFLIFGEISYRAERRKIKYAHNLSLLKQELEVSVSNVPEANRKEPSSQVVLQALEQAKYCVEEPELRKMFVALLTASVDSFKHVHPSFSTIISQMSPTDARMLEIFKRTSQYMICDLKQILNATGSFRPVEDNIFLSGPDDIPQSMQSVSISSLIHLGLLEIPFDQYIEPESAYDIFKTSDAYYMALRKYAANELDFERKIVRLTRLGKSFISCCLPSPGLSARLL